MKSIITCIILALVLTSCESLKELGMEDKIKQAAKDWIVKAIDQYGVPKTSPVIANRAEDIADPELKEEVLSQLSETKKTHQ